MAFFHPEFFTFEELMCVFLAVVASDVILLDIFNTLGMPTSTTVSMVFELLGGSTALALVKMLHDSSLTYAGLINTDKAFTVILAIFLSVAIAFCFRNVGAMDFPPYFYLFTIPSILNIP